jgi:peptide/nickel transport system permease protein
VRLASSLAILFALSFALFGVLSALPGDPVDLLVTSNPNVKPEDIARLKKLRGLDQPWPVQWARWLFGHAEPKEPPPLPPPEVHAVELPSEGAAVVEVRGVKREYRAPGIYDEPYVVGDDVQAVVIDQVYAAPTISPVPTPSDDGAHLDETERQLGGATESATGVGRASEAEIIEAAKRAGRAFGVAPLHEVEANVDAHLCSADAHARVPQVELAGPGRTVVVFTCERGDVVARGAFIIDHGVATDPARYHRGAIAALLGDGEALGYSSTYKRPVVELLSGRVQNTLLLMVPAFLVALLTAIALATVAASKRGSPIDRAIVASSIFSVSVPSFWLGLMGIVILAAKLQVLPAGGIEQPGLSGVDAFFDVVAHAVLPVLVLAIGYAGPFLRYTRASLVDVLPSDFVRTARAKGLAPRTVLLRHALPNALLSLITVTALQAPQMFAGALLTETVFAWPGIGRLQYEAIVDNDSYVAIVVFLISAALVFAANVAADVLYGVVDPRLRRR